MAVSLYPVQVNTVLLARLDQVTTNLESFQPMKWDVTMFTLIDKSKCVGGSQEKYAPSAYDPHACELLLNRCQYHGGLAEGGL